VFTIDREQIDVDSGLAKPIAPALMVFKYRPDSAAVMPSTTTRSLIAACGIKSTFRPAGPADDQPEGAITREVALHEQVVSV
jgi:hypothetical protein